MSREPEFGVAREDASGRRYAWAMSDEVHQGRSDEPGSSDGVFEAAVAAHEAGRLEEAERLYREVIRREPDDAASHELLGQVLLSRGAIEEACAALRRSTELDDGSWGAWLSLSSSLAALGRVDEATETCRRAMSIDDGSPAIRIHWAVLLAGRQDIDDLGKILAGLVAEPKLEEPQLRLLAGLARMADRMDLLATLIERLGSLSDLEFEELLQHAMSRCRQGRLEGIERVLLLLHRHRPARADIGIPLANYLMSSERWGEAAEVLERSISADPSDAQSALMLVGLCSTRGEEARAREALRLTKPGPDHLWPALLADAALSLRRCYGSEVERVESQDRLRRLLAQAEDGLVASDAASSRRAVEAIVGTAFFLLPALGGDVRSEAESLGRIVTRSVGGTAPEVVEEPLAPRRSADGRLRVGVLSALFRQHSNWRFKLSWLCGLDARRFEVSAYSTRGASDWVRDEARRRYERFVDLKGDVMEVIRRIREERLDAIVIPEVGMDPITRVVAAARLAPVQCTSWGHPVTSGYASCGWFLSSGLMEPEDGDRHYSERLVRLPGLGVCLDVPTWIDPTGRRERLGVPSGAVSFWCSQSLHKYLPQDDRIYAAIAARVPRAVFVFIGPDDESRRRLSDRLHRTMSESGLDGLRHLRWLDPVSPEEFVRIGGECDVFLDCPAWSGCNTTLDAVRAGLPIVTWPGSTMRARHTAAMLEQMDLPEFVARDEAGFVELAVRMGSDGELRRHARELIIGRRERLFGDRRPIEALERFIEQAAEGAS